MELPLRPRYRIRRHTMLRKELSDSQRRGPIELLPGLSVLYLCQYSFCLTIPSLLRA